MTNRRYVSAAAFALLALAVGLLVWDAGRLSRSVADANTALQAIDATEICGRITAYRAGAGAFPASLREIDVRELVGSRLSYSYATFNDRSAYELSAVYRDPQGVIDVRSLCATPVPAESMVFRD